MLGWIPEKGRDGLGGAGGPADGPEAVLTSYTGLGDTGAAEVGTLCVPEAGPGGDALFVPSYTSQKIYCATLRY